MNLQDYWENIKLADNTIAGCCAYLMDGDHSRPRSERRINDMRIDVGLGTCSCVDYFSPQNNSVLVIEESRVNATIKKYKDKYDYLNIEDQVEIVEKLLKQEIQLKAYGSSLVLCLLSKKCKNAREVLKGKKYEFWVVVTDTTAHEDIKFFQNLEIIISSTLRKLVMNVRVLFLNDFKKEFPLAKDETSDTGPA